MYLCASTIDGPQKSARRAADATRKVLGSVRKAF